MDFIRSHKLIVATIVIQIIALPLVLIMVKQKQQTTSQAQKSTTLFFTPSSTSNSPIQATVGQNMTLDLMINPGNNLVSFAKIEITYDPALFTPDPTNPVTVDTNQSTGAFSTIVEGPVVSSGKILIALSIGPSNIGAIATQRRVLTLNLKPTASSNNQTTSIGFGSTTELSSISGSDTLYENVLSAATPAIVKVTVTNSPTPTPQPTSTPTPQPSNTPTPSPTPSPTKIPTPTPSPTAVPTPTIEPVTSTILKFTGLKLHGLGKGGDNPNPNSIGTLNPLRPTRTLVVTLLNSSNAVVQTINGSITYTGPTTGVFDGDVVVPNTTPNGDYTVKISSPTYLAKTIPGWITLTKGATINMTPVSLSAGDVDGDGVREADDDYNIIMGCYADLQPAKNCNATKKLAADISDDGKVDQDDYNLFLRELSVQTGD